MKNTPYSSPQARKKMGFAPYTGGKLMGNTPYTWSSPQARKNRVLHCIQVGNWWKNLLWLAAGAKKSGFAPYTGGKLMKNTSIARRRREKIWFCTVYRWENGTFGPPQAQNRRFWQNPQNLTRSQNLSSDEQGGGFRGGGGFRLGLRLIHFILITTPAHSTRI